MTESGTTAHQTVEAKWRRAQAALARDQKHEFLAGFVAYALSAGPMAAFAADYGAGYENGAALTLGMLVLLGVGLGILSWRWSLRSWTPTGFDWRIFVSRLWNWLCVVGACSTPGLLFGDWNGKHGALTNMRYFAQIATAVGAYLGLQIVGLAVRNPIRTVKLSGWMLMAGLAAGAVQCGADVLEHVSVKALLVAILVVLIVQTTHRPAR